MREPSLSCAERAYRTLGSVQFAESAGGVKTSRWAKVEGVFALDGAAETIEIRDRRTVESLMVADDRVG